MPIVSNPQVLFVSEEKIKSFTSINYNVSPSDLTPHIFNAQSIFMSEFLGGSYYEALKTRVAAETLTTADTTLLDGYVGPVVLNYALYLALPFLKSKMFNKGVLSGNSENADAVSLQEIQWIQQQVLDVAQNYVKRMQEYIKHRLSDYPLYANPEAEDGQIPNKEEPYRSSIVTLGKSCNKYDL